MTATTRTPPPVRHRLDERHVTALCRGGGDAETIAEILATERSWRMLACRAVMENAAGEPSSSGPLPPMAQAWQLLASAERAARSEVDVIFRHPPLGTWASHALRRLRGSTTDQTAPLWVDLGYLHALAAAAAIRAGLDFVIDVPARDGFVVLPTLGAARLPDITPWDVARVRGEGGAVTVRAGGTTLSAADGASGWLPLRRLSASAAGHDLSVRLDDLDPYRNLRDATPPQPVSPASAQRWEATLPAAWQLLAQTSPRLAGPIAGGLASIVPQPPAERFRPRSASADDAFGSAVMSEIDDPVELAVTLVHEFQHNKLGGLLHLAPLRRAGPPRQLYAPWRDDPRPLPGVIQGVYAFTGITEFWRALRGTASGTTAQLAQVEFARWRQGVWTTLDSLSALPELTGLGRRLLAGLTETAAGWREESVPSPLQAAADIMVFDHRTLWRLHHLRPGRTELSSLAAAWLAGADPPPADRTVPEPQVTTDPNARLLASRAVLHRWRMVDPDGYLRLRSDPERVGRQVAGAQPADLAFTDGQWPRARTLYLARLADDPDQIRAWAGLASTIRAAAETGSGVDAATASLLRRPELVRALHQEIRAAGGRSPDPLALASWLSRR